MIDLESYLEVIPGPKVIIRPPKRRPVHLTCMQNAILRGHVAIAFQRPLPGAN